VLAAVAAVLETHILSRWGKDGAFNNTLVGGPCGICWNGVFILRATEHNSITMGIQRGSQPKASRPVVG